MRLLLDTHIFIWCVADDPRLTDKLKSRILTADEVYVSSASIWEAIIKIQIKKLEASANDLVDAISASGFIELPITVQHALTISKLPDIHKDPFDRILVAQALSEPLIFITADSHLKNYSDLIEVI